MEEKKDSLLPRELDDNLLLRWANAKDIEPLAAFNVRLHSDDAQRPETWLGAWTRDLMDGRHPTTTAANFTIVATADSGAIVSSQALISQTWAYEGLPFGVGRIELVGTDEAYRRRGLVREQMAAAHALSTRKGHLVQAITGIPWFYRAFGYEMAVNLGGGREYFWARSGNDKPLHSEPYQMRPATMADLLLLQTLYAQHCAGSLLVRRRSQAEWRYELETANREGIGALKAHMISDEEGRDVAYVVFFTEAAAFVIREFGVLPGHSWRSAALFVARELKRRADELNQEREKPISQISIILDDSHPLIVALGGQLEKRRDPYAWYIRVPDLHRFLAHIAPALEERLAGSVVAGHTGRLRLNLYQDTVEILFTKGKIWGSAATRLVMLKMGTPCSPT